MTLRVGAKITERRQVDKESNWLPASGQFSLYIRVYWAGATSSMVSGDRRLSSEYNRAVNYGARDAVPRCERTKYRTSVVGP
ncbi:MULTISPECIES: DUF1214 domain-containing protein [Bradyrhizobium]|uniref:DUF1214 domain-containing protein n=1 Tax=Bradyrhizobium TaxID=374 RepID=UPI001CEC17C1|nr:DUF1214 domain-containing protein [Bradyrhizobium japonicum]